MLFKLYNSLLSLLGNIFDQTKMQHIEVRALKNEVNIYSTHFSLCTGTLVINNFLFRIDTHKDKDQDKENSFLLVIPEKYEPIIFHTYHDSLLVGHQGPYKRAMTIRQRFFIHNLMNKVKRYIKTYNTCLKTKPKYKKNRPVYGGIPIDYAPMQDLSLTSNTCPWLLVDTNIFW